MDFPHTDVMKLVLSLMRKKRRAVGESGRTWDECCHDLVSHVWMRFGAGKYDAERGAFAAWAYCQASSKLKDMVRDNGVVVKHDEKVRRYAEERWRGEYVAAL